MTSPKDIEISKASLIARRKALLKSLAEDSFHEFVRQAWAIVEPDVEYRDNWHIGALCDHLSAVNDGKIKQLLINVPPGAMKSLLVCVFWPAWVWAKSPAKRFLFASYSDGLTMRDSVRCRNILSSDWYQSNWPIKFKDDQNTKGLFENSQGGWRLSTSVGGKGTGLHPDVVCVYKDTLILTEKGNVPIGPLVENRLPERVATWNEAMGTVEWRQILAYEKHVGRACVRITTRGGRKLECTEEHPIYVSLAPNKGTYIPAVDCVVGMVLITKSAGVVGDHGYDLIESIEGIPAPEHVYNLNVDGNHNYFANGILTHNCADDPNNAKEAESEADRQNVIDWWDGTISTRGVSRGVSQIVVQQRLHTMDLTGHLMGKGTWDHICLPMRYEADRMKTTSLGFQDPRGKDGELLWPDLFTEEMVTRLEKTMGIHHVAGQLQQRPAPRGGGMFKREWFDVLGYEPQFVRLVRFFDKAGTLGGKGARTAGVLMGRTEKGMFVILDVVKERLGAVEREALIKRMAIVDAQRYDGRVTTYVEQEPGSGGKESAEATVRNLAGFDCRIERVTGAKEVRAEPMAAQASVGNVKLLKGRWNEEFLDEIEVFPVGRLKDQCDAASGALNKLCEVTGAFGQVHAEMPPVAVPQGESEFVHSDAEFGDSTGGEAFFGK
jgi:predicted phage terminase large subunit-like protein